VALYLNPVPPPNPSESGALRNVTSTQFSQDAGTAVLDVGVLGTRVPPALGTDERIRHQPRDAARVD
jgi:hypothetical protein